MTFAVKSRYNELINLSNLCVHDWDISWQDFGDKTGAHFLQVESSKNFLNIAYISLYSFM